MKLISTLRKQLGIGKLKERSQMCEMYTQDGRLLLIELPINEHGCIMDEKRHKAFVVDPSNQYEGEDGHYYQILSEMSVFPIRSINRDNTQELEDFIKHIYKDTKEQAKLNQFLNANKNDAFNKVMWLISVPCVTFAVIFIIQHFWK